MQYAGTGPVHTLPMCICPDYSFTAVIGNVHYTPHPHTPRSAQLPVHTQGAITRNPNMLQSKPIQGGPGARNIHGAGGIVVNSAAAPPQHISYTHTHTHVYMYVHPYIIDVTKPQCQHMSGIISNGVLPIVGSLHSFH